MSPRAVLLLVLGFALPACISTRSTSGNLLEYLYPDKYAETLPAPAPDAGRGLRPPLSVGVAIVPGGTSSQVGAVTAVDSVGEVLKQEVLERLGREIGALPAVGEVHVLPDTYLRPGGGVDDLVRLKDAFDLDLLVLVSYDQSWFSETTGWSISYLLLLPMWFVPGERAFSETFLDAAVLDLEGRELLARADGRAAVRRSYVPVFQGSAQRETTQETFELAMDDLLKGLLPRLRERLPAGP